MPKTNARVKLVGQDGNAFYILGVTKRAIAKSDKPELAEEYTREAMSGDYDNLLRVTMEYVTVT